MSKPDKVTKFIYIPFDPAKYPTVGKYCNDLPTWSPKHVAIDGRYLEVWYDHQSRNWVLQEFDADGSTNDSIYFGTEFDALMCARCWQNNWMLK